MTNAPKDRSGDDARIPDDLAKVYANAPKIPEHLDKPIKDLTPEQQREKGLIYARHESEGIEHMPWNSIEGAEGEYWPRVERDMGTKESWYGARMSQVDPSIASTLNALGYNFNDSRENLDDPEEGHNRPLTVAELEDRKDRGFDTEINAGIMRRYGIDEKTGRRPSDVLANANAATDAAADADFFASDAETTAEPYVRRAQRLRQEADEAETAKSAANESVDALIKPATPATAPANRANHPGRVVHDPWASDPAGPNEAFNATEAREMYEHNADNILRDNAPEGSTPEDYADVDTDAYRNDNEGPFIPEDSKPPF